MRVAALVLVVVAAVAGCDRVFGIDPGRLHGDASGGIDAPPPPTTDAPIDAQFDALDEDGDGIADLGDNCPGIANPGQDNTGEVTNGQPQDPVGDACDPHPANTGDFIVHQRFFNNPTGDAQDWVVDGGWQFRQGFVELGASGMPSSLTHNIALDSSKSNTVELAVGVVAPSPSDKVGVRLDSAGIECWTVDTPLTLHVEESGGSSGIAVGINGTVPPRRVIRLTARSAADPPARSWTRWPRSWWCPPRPAPACSVSSS